MCIYIYMYVCVCVHVCIHACITCIYIYTSIYSVPTLYTHTYICIYIYIYFHTHIIYVIYSHVHVTCSTSYVHVPTPLLHLECFIPQSPRHRSPPLPMVHLCHNWHAARCPKIPLICIYITSGAVLGLPLTPYGYLKPPLATCRTARHVHKKSLSWPIQPQSRNGQRRNLGMQGRVGRRLRGGAFALKTGT